MIGFFLQKIKKKKKIYIYIYIDDWLGCMDFCLVKS